MNQAFVSKTVNPEKASSNGEKLPEDQSLVPGGFKPDPNMNRGPMMNGPPPVRGGAPHIVYDPADFQDRSESTWAQCPNCNQIGMSVIKHEFSCRAYWGSFTNEHLAIERVHYCAFCDTEMGRRKNATCCCFK